MTTTAGRVLPDNVVPFPRQSAASPDALTTRHAGEVEALLDRHAQLIDLLWQLHDVLRRYNAALLHLAEAKCEAGQP